jgi:hypothetical protein
MIQTNSNVKLLNVLHQIVNYAKKMNYINVKNAKVDMFLVNLMSA